MQLSRESTHYRLESGRAESTSVLGFLRSGANHVLYGLDHILFLIALLLVVCLRQREGGGLQARSLRESLSETARWSTTRPARRIGLCGAGLTLMRQ